MAEEKHTPGRLKVNPYTGWIVTEGDPYGHGSMHVADVRGWDHLTGVGACNLDEETAYAIQQANAQRIVATWNACEGIPTEALEPGVVRELVEALEALVDELEWEIGEEKWGRDPDALPMARAVLAKVWVSVE